MPSVPLLSLTGNCMPAHKVLLIFLHPFLLFHYSHGRYFFFLFRASEDPSRQQLRSLHSTAPLLAHFSVSSSLLLQHFCCLHENVIWVLIQVSHFPVARFAPLYFCSLCRLCTFYISHSAPDESMNKNICGHLVSFCG